MDTDSELKDVLHTGQSTPAGSTDSSRDDAILARLGKKPVLKRHFGFMSILGFSCTVLITWEGSLGSTATHPRMHDPELTNAGNGGPSGIVYGFIVVWVGTVSVFATISELTSMAPTSGGQYHWISMLAPPRYRRFLGYIAGWLTVIGWQAVVASGGFVTGTMIQGLILLTHPDYAENMKNWHGTLLFWGVVFVCYVINTAGGPLLARFEGFVLILHLVGFFAVLLPMVILSDHGTATDGLSFCIGISGSVFAFLGGDAAIHMSEEIRNAAIVVPRSIMTGLAINGTLGFGMMIATLYCLGDMDAGLAENPQYPIMAIFRHAVGGSTAGAAVMSSIIVVMSFSATTGCLASASRIYWAFSRDRGLPGWKVLRKVSPRTSIPRHAVLTTTLIAILLSLVNIGDATAFNGVISISVAGLFGSYLIATSLLLYRRLTGGIHLPEGDDALTNTMGTHLTWGPWRLPGALGIANNIFSCAYLLFVFFFSFWPSSREVTPQNFNWAVLVFGTAILFSVFYYAVWAGKFYVGPVIEVGNRSL
ncbi:putative GABA permease [Hypoxylon sp. FL1284]|nr:putative GABA permease [Hypoxylon sp. FL1284]